MYGIKKRGGGRVVEVRQLVFMALHGMHVQNISALECSEGRNFDPLTPKVTHWSPAQIQMNQFQQKGFKFQRSDPGNHYHQNPHVSGIHGRAWKTQNLPSCVASQTRDFFF